MFFSRRFDYVTVLLWGDRWWLPNHKLPVPFTDIGQAVTMLAEAWPFEERTLRLIYQPDEFETVATDCPYGNRTTLAAALADPFPALAHPGHVWSFEPILAHGESFRTLVHFETRPSLFGLVHQLREHGFTVVTVWPMATWLNALPPELSESGAMSVVALTAERYCAYRHSAGGERSAHAGRAENSVSGVIPHLRGSPPELQGMEYLLYVTTDEKFVDDLNNRLPVSETQIAGVLSLWDALAKPVVLSLHHPAQLLPPVPRVSLRSVCQAGSTGALMLGLGMLAVGAYRHATFNRGDDRHAELVGEVEHLRSNAAEFERLTAEREQSARPPPSEILTRLSVATQPALALTRVHIDANGFVVSAAVPPSTGIVPAGWLARLEDRRWKIQSSPTDPPGCFQVTAALVR